MSLAEDFTPVSDIFPEETIGDMEDQKKIPLPVILEPEEALEAEASPVTVKSPEPGAKVYAPKLYSPYLFPDPVLDKASIVMSPPPDTIEPLPSK